MIGIVDYGLGNLTSVAAAVGRLGFEARVTADPTLLSHCEKLILPGVGAFRDGMRNLRERSLVEPLDRLVNGVGKPILGICLGSQLMATESEEFGREVGLGWIDARVVRITPDDPELRIPHVGWNDLIRVRGCLLFDGLPEEALFYYVHSFRIDLADESTVVGKCDYGGRFVAAVQRDNIYATQFHPEKSQRDGLTLLRNFLDRA